MERILSTAQMQSADRYTINTLGIPEEVLVERAGRAVADEIISRFCGGRILVCIGKGNNGADGRIIAEILSKKHGFSVATLTVSNGIFKLFEKKSHIPPSAFIDKSRGIWYNKIYSVRSRALGRLWSFL